MKVEKSMWNYSPVSILFETYEEYRQLEVMLHYISGNSVKHSNFATQLLEALNGLKKD